MKHMEDVVLDKMIPSSIYRIVKMVGFHISKHTVKNIFNLYRLIVNFVIVPMANRMEETVQQSLPPGLIIIENFITSDEEGMLINLIKWTKCDDEEQCNAVLKHRQVKHFGYEFRYDTNNVDVNKPLIDEPIPAECDFLWDRLRSQHIQLHETSPHQLTVNKYEPGQGKNIPHTLRYTEYILLGVLLNILLFVFFLAFRYPITCGYTQCIYGSNHFALIGR